MNLDLKVRNGTPQGIQIALQVVGLGVVHLCSHAHPIRGVHSSIVELGVPVTALCDQCRGGSKVGLFKDGGQEIVALLVGAHPVHDLVQILQHVLHVPELAGGLIVGLDVVLVKERLGIGVPSLLKAHDHIPKVGTSFGSSDAYIRQDAQGRTEVGGQGLHVPVNPGQRLTRRSKRGHRLPHHGDIGGSRCRGNGQDIGEVAKVFLGLIQPEGRKAVGQILRSLPHGQRTGTGQVEGGTEGGHDLPLVIACHGQIVGGLRRIHGRKRGGSPQLPDRTL